MYRIIAAELLLRRQAQMQGGYLTLTALTDGSKVTLTKVGKPPAVSLEYSTGGAWATYTIGTEITLTSAGDYIKFRGDNSTFSTTANDYYQFSMSGTIGASGNVMSLVDSTCKLLTIPCDYCYYYMFHSCTGLTTAPALPATTLATNCYRAMFQGCTGLTTAPASLPATTLAQQCYHGMFSICTSLTTAPALPATTLATSCYYYMFNGCTSLTTAPALPATTLATSCYYYMFNGCTKLSSIEVSFTSWTQASNPTSGWVNNVASSGTFTKPTALAEEYGTNRIPTGWTVTMKPLTLTARTAGSKVTLNKVGSPPDISLEYSTGGAWTTYTIGTEITLTSAGDRIKFRGDNGTFSTSTNNYYQFAMSGTIAASGNIMSLVDSAMVSTTIPCDYCYYYMFQGCTGLTSAPELPATTLADSCYYYLFQGCTGLTTAPALPATTLASNCYGYMFRGCTGLTTAPALPATTLVIFCYQFMFYGCTELSSIEVSFTSWTQASNPTSGWVNNVASSGTFTKPTALAAAYGTNRIPTGWTVINK